jgi:hypothetical protein
MSDERFNWSNDETVLVKSVKAVAVYTNPDGDVVTRQEADDVLFQEDPFIVVPLIQLDRLIERLSKIRDELYD